MLTEALTYWFFRLNGCFTIQDFVVHPGTQRHQHTDVDVLAVRFPHRSELALDGRPMTDHALFNHARRQLFIVEVKKAKGGFNPSWRNPEERNMERILHAVGVLVPDKIDEAAKALYEAHSYESPAIDVRLVLVKKRRSPDIPAVQITWDEMLGFIFDRMSDFRDEKADHSQWDDLGKQLFADAEAYAGRKEAFVARWVAQLPG